MPKGISWTPLTTKELLILRRAYKEGGAKAVQIVLPHRSLNAIYRVASEQRYRKLAIWTSREIAILRESYPMGGWRAVQQRLPPRSYFRIAAKAAYLKIKRNPEKLRQERVQRLHRDKPPPETLPYHEQIRRPPGPEIWETI